MASILDTPTSAQATPHSFVVSAGVNRGMIVGIEQEGTTLGAPTVAYGGESMTNVVDLEINPGTTSQRVTLFHLNDAGIENAVGTNIVVSNAVTVMTIHAASYEDCVQTTPTNTDSDSSTVEAPNPLADCDIVTGAANAVVVALSGMGNAGTATWGGTLTERTDVQDSTATATGSLADDEVPTATTIACECTWATPNRHAIVALELVHLASEGISSVDPTTFDMDNGDIDINGTNFEASQGTGTVYLSDADTLAGSVNEVEIENGINTWSDTVVNLDLTGLTQTEIDNLNTLGPGTRYLILVNNSSDEYGSTALTVHRAEAFVISLGAGTPGASTARLTAPDTKDTGDFTAGRFEEAANPATAVDIAADFYTEMVWSIEAKPLSREVQYDFRVTKSGSVIDDYTVTPQVTIASTVIVEMGAVTLASSAQGLNVNAPITIPMGTVTLASSVQALNTVAVDQIVLMDPIYRTLVVQKMMGPAVEGYVTGYHLAGTAASITRSGSGEVWTYPERALTSETSSSFAFSFIADPEYTDYLRLTDFGFTDSHIPVGSTIRGIELLMERAGVQSNNIQDSVISISLSGSVIGDNQAEVEGWLNTYELKYRPSSGASTDDWGAGLDQTDVVDSTFGVVVSAEAIGGAGDQSPYIECMWVRIYYAEAQTVALGVAALASSAQGLNVYAATTIQMGAVTLASSAEAATVSAPPPAQTVTLSEATLASSPQGLNVAVGTATVQMGAVTLTSSPQALDVIPGGTTVQLSAATLVSAAQTLDILVGETTVSMSAATLVASALSFKIIGADLVVPMSAATLASTAQTLRSVATDQVVDLLTQRAYLNLPFADVNFPTGVWTRRHAPGHEATIDTGEGNQWEDLQGASFLHAIVAGAEDYDKSAHVTVTATFSDWLRLTRFGFSEGSIPSSSNIVGIEVKMFVRRQATAGTARSVRLRLAGGVQGDDKATAVEFTTSFVVYTYGGPTDDWNAGFDPTDLHTTGFGLDFQVESGAVSIPHVDWVVMRVWWMWPPVPMSAATLASSAQALTVVATGAPQTISMSAATLASSAQGLTAIAGAVTVPMGAATLASSAQALTITGAVAVPMSAATLASSAQTLDVIEGAVAVDQSAATLVSSAQSLTPVGGAVTVSLSVVTLASSAQILVANAPVAGVVYPVAITLASSAENLTVVPGATTVSMSAVTLASSAQSARVEVAQIVALGAVTLASSPQGLTVKFVQVVFASEATLVSSAQALTVVPGATTVQLSAVTLTAAPQDLRATGISTVSMGAITLASSPQALTVAVAGPTIAMGAITLASSAQSFTPAPGIVYVIMATATLVAAAQDIRYLAPVPAVFNLDHYLITIYDVQYEERASCKIDVMNYTYS